jgi:hypothetical protein
MSGIGHALLVPALGQHYASQGAAEEVDSTPRIPTGAAGAWSCARKLVAGYSGYAIQAIMTTPFIQVQNVGFVNNVLDTATLLAWAGSGTAYVGTVYDQSGNGRDLNQFDAAKRPIIVNGGSLVTKGASIPTMDFTTGRRLERTDALGLTGAPAITIGHVFEMTNAGPYPPMVAIGRGVATATAGLCFCHIGNGSAATHSYISAIDHGPNYVLTHSIATLRTYVVRSAASTGIGSARMQQDGVDCGLQSVAGNGALNLNLPNENFCWGGGKGAVGVLGDVTGYGSVCVVYNEDMSGARLTDFNTVLALHK